MLTRLRATYSKGVFVPFPSELPLDLPEATEVEIIVQEPPARSDAARRARQLRAIAESMKAHSFTGDPPRFTREELHERR